MTVECEIGFIKSRKLMEMLREDIKGRIVTYYYEDSDRIKVTIFTDEIGAWEFITNSVLDRKTYELYCEVYNRYKSFILKRFFEPVAKPQYTEYE